MAHGSHNHIATSACQLLCGIHVCLGRCSHTYNNGVETTFGDFMLERIERTYTIVVEYCGFGIVGATAREHRLYAIFITHHHHSNFAVVQILQWENIVSRLHHGHSRCHHLALEHLRFRSVDVSHNVGEVDLRFGV